MTPAPAFYVLLFLFGLMIGSFLNVCISRIPAGVSVVFPPSKCPRCKTRIAWYDNIPVLSYLMLRAKCRTCALPISAMYPAIELVTAVAFLLQGLAVDGDLPLLASRLILTGLLVVLFGTDLQTMRLPNALTYPGIVLGLISNLILPPPPGLVSALIGAALGAAVPWLIGWVWLRVRGVQGMGLGDVKMLAMIGAFLGWQQVMVVLFLSSLVGALVGVSLIMAGKRSWSSKLPFGTYIAMAAYAASLIGVPLIDWYVGLYQ